MNFWFYAIFVSCTFLIYYFFYLCHLFSYLLLFLHRGFCAPLGEGLVSLGEGKALVTLFVQDGANTVTIAASAAVRRIDTARIEVQYIGIAAV